MVSRAGKTLFILSILLIVTGCATLPPIKHKIKTKETYTAPYDKFWELANDSVSIIAAIEKADKKSGVIRTKEFNVPYEGFQYISKYADCGEPGGMYVYRGIIGYFDISISEIDGNKVKFEANAHYRAPLWFGKSFKGMVVCQSRGHLERQLFKDLRMYVSEFKKSEAEKPEDQEDSAPELSQAYQKEKSECINILPTLRQDLFRRILTDSKEKGEQPSL
jgi:hypothetical protein